MGGEERWREKKMLVGVVWNCATEIKLLLIALLFVFSLISLFQFLPSGLYHYYFSLPCPALPQSAATPSGVLREASPHATPPAREARDSLLDGGVVKRAFNPYGSASYNFVLMSAYRGGVDTFAVVGLASKPLHVFGRPTYLCEWVPVNSNTTSSSSSSSRPVTAVGKKILPDWGFGRVYTVVVVNCTFPFPVGGSSSSSSDGGKLLLHASTNGGGDSNSNATDTVLGLKEAPGRLDPLLFTSPPQYEYLYCGSSLYGNLSPQKVREWLAYHVRMFGPRSHFVIHDAGGVHPAVMEVLRPWMERGYVSLQDIREQERFDGYYHNQFLIVNDCLHRYRFRAKWMFFFDMDEFIFVPKRTTMESLLDSLSNYTQFTIDQMPMSNKLCLAKDAGKTHRKWGFEKLVYRDTKRGIRRDRKYAVQPRSVFATGVHMSENFSGKTTHDTRGRIMYYHYHGTISNRREPCRQLANTTELKLDGNPYVLDTTIREVAGEVKRFELNTIGPILQKTRQ